MFLMRVEGAAVFRCESVNQSYLAVTGLKDVVGRRIEEILPPAAAGFALEILRGRCSAGWADRL